MRTEGATEATATEASDAELMAQVRAGELEQLAVLFERHHRRLLSFFLRLAGDRAAAEDLVQEVFVRMLKYRHTFREPAEFTPWMFGVARNAAIDHYRARPRELPESPEAPEPAAPHVDPVERIDRRQQSELLQAALGRLPREKRELLLLARFGEMKYESIGELLGISVGAVKVRVHRALKELREAYRLVSEGGAA